MKRSKVVELIENWLKPEIYDDVYFCNRKEWADNLLYKLEVEYGMLPPDNCSDGNCNQHEFNTCGNQWEPEDDVNDADKYCGAV